MQRYIDGAPTWRNFGWRTLGDYAMTNVIDNAGDMNCSRERYTVSIRGNFHVASGVTLGADTVFLNVPNWAIPYERIMFQVFGYDRTTKWCYINNVGQVAMSDVLTANMAYVANFSYRMW